MAEGTADIQEVLGSLVTLDTSLQTGAFETLNEGTQVAIEIGVVDVVVFGGVTIITSANQGTVVRSILADSHHRIGDVVVAH